MKTFTSKFALLVIFALSLPLSGCVFDRSSPEKVLKSAYSALLRDDLRDFRATLGRDMKQQFRTVDDMAPLKETLNGYERLNVSPAQLISTEQRELRVCNNVSAYPRYQTVDAKHKYDVQIVGTPVATKGIVPIMTAGVECTVSYNRVSQRGGRCYRKGTTFCSITELR